MDRERQKDRTVSEKKMKYLDRKGKKETKKQMRSRESSRYFTRYFMLLSYSFSFLLIFLTELLLFLSKSCLFISFFTHFVFFSDISSSHSTDTGLGIKIRDGSPAPSSYSNQDGMEGRKKRKLVLTCHEEEGDYYEKQ